MSKYVVFLQLEFYIVISIGGKLANFLIVILLFTCTLKTKICIWVFFLQAW